MSARKGIVASQRTACDGGVSPNQYIGHITAEVRLFFPPNTVTKEQIRLALFEAYSEAANKVDSYFEERDA